MASRSATRQRAGGRSGSPRSRRCPGVPEGSWRASRARRCRPGCHPAGARSATPISESGPRIVPGRQHGGISDERPVADVGPTEGHPAVVEGRAPDRRHVGDEALLARASAGRDPDARPSTPPRRVRPVRPATAARAPCRASRTANWCRSDSSPAACPPATCARRSMSGRGAHLPACWAAPAYAGRRPGRRALTTKTGPTNAAAIRPVNSSVASSTLQTSARRRDQGHAAGRPPASPSPAATAVRCGRVQSAAAGSTPAPPRSDPTASEPGGRRARPLLAGRNALAFEQPWTARARMAPAPTVEPGSSTAPEPTKAFAPMMIGCDDDPAVLDDPGPHGDAVPDAGAVHRSEIRAGSTRSPSRHERRVRRRAPRRRRKGASQR